MELYPLDDFKQLVGAERWFYLNERRIYKFLDRLNDELGWTDENIKEVLLGLSADDFQRTVRDCKVANFPGKLHVDADQYEIHWDIEAKIGRQDVTVNTFSFSLKIIIDVDVDGAFAGIVTFHASGSP